MANPKMLAELRIFLRQQAREWLQEHPGALQPNEGLTLNTTVYFRRAARQVETERITAEISEQEWEQILQKPWPDYFLGFLRNLRDSGNVLPPDYERIGEEVQQAGYASPSSFFQSLNYHFMKFGLPFRFLVVERLGPKLNTRRIYRIKL